MRAYVEKRLELGFPGKPGEKLANIFAKDFASTLQLR